jgi:hypothetical protein
MAFSHLALILAGVSESYCTLLSNLLSSVALIQYLV